MTNKVDVVHVEGSKEFEMYLSGFTDVYKQAFSGAPYFEKFRDEEVVEIFGELVNWDGGYCSVIVNAGVVVGLCGGFQLKFDSDVALMVAKHLAEDSLDKIFYLAELAVDDDFRHHGFGSMLVEDAIEHLSEKTDFDQILVRTQKQGSNAVNIFKRLGMNVVPDMIQNVETYIGQNGDRKLVTQERVFLNIKL